MNEKYIIRVVQITENGDVYVLSNSATWVKTSIDQLVALAANKKPA